MAGDLRADEVAHSLAILRERYVPETITEAALRLDAERPPSIESFEQQVARCLDELSALCDLVEHLQQARFSRLP